MYFVSMKKLPDTNNDLNSRQPLFTIPLLVDSFKNEFAAEILTPVCLARS